MFAEDRDSILPRAVAWHDGELRLLDQTRLPQAEVYVSCRDVETVYEAIASLRVRGAPAIGIAAAYGLLLPFQDIHVPDELRVQDSQVSIEELQRRADYLIQARPTAVNLAWAIKRMLNSAQGRQNVDVLTLLKEAKAIHAEDAKACRAIGEFGAPLVSGHPRLLTHCNAGALAVSELGTALAPIYVAHRQGIKLHVFVDETRPLLQGARLTAWELRRAGVDSTLITDSMAATVMAEGRVDAVIVGADRVAANGDVANKIGTLNLAILCKYFNLPFYVACPWSTIDLNTPQGSDIAIEQRLSSEVTRIMDVPIAPDGVGVFNPAFDVTPAALVTCVITERGVIEPPFAVNLRAG